MELQNACPASVARGVALLWLTLGITALGAVVNRLLGLIGEEEFVAVLLFYALFAVFPYKIGRGSNAVRIVYVVLLTGSLLFSIGTGFSTVTKVDVILSIILLPAELYAVYCLFTAEANQWFSAH